MAEYRFGNKARIEIAPYGNGTMPAFDSPNWRHFCLTSEVTIGTEKGSVTIENWCIGGEAEVPDGTSKGILTFGEAQWVENDPACAILEDAAYNDTESGGKVWYRILPLGRGEGKPVFRGTFNVFKWELMTKLKGTVSAQHDVKPEGRPERGVLTSNNDFSPLSSRMAVVPLTGAALTDNVAATVPNTVAGQVVTYTINTTAAGNIVASVSGGTGSAEARIKDATGVIVGGLGATSTASGQPAGTYKIDVVSTTNASGVQLTVDWPTV